MLKLVNLLALIIAAFSKRMQFQDSAPNEACTILWDYLTNIINGKVRLFVTPSRENYSTDHHETLYTDSWRFQK